MSERKNWRPSYVFVTMLILLAGVLAYLAVTALDTGTTEVARMVEAPEAGQSAGGQAARPIAAEAGPFRHATAGNGKEAPAPAGRHLQGYYQRRAYPGAPPMIPHEVSSNPEAQAQACNQCHEAGGYAAKFSAFTPMTPHPEFLNCRQCHAAGDRKPRPFRGNRWVKIAGPRLGLSALPGAPPRIPHGLQMRENCVACHSGGGAVAEIATSHAERGNCRQCHVPWTTSGTWSRP